MSTITLDCVLHPRHCVPCVSQMPCAERQKCRAGCDAPEKARTPSCTAASHVGWASAIIDAESRNGQDDLAADGQDDLRDIRPG